jgi:hypothetical protein
MPVDELVLDGRRDGLRSPPDDRTVAILTNRWRYNSAESGLK